MTRSRPPHRILTPLGLAVALSLSGDLTLYAVLVTQMEVVGLTLADVGVMLSVNRLVRIPGNPLIGLLLDRWGRRRLFILGMVIGVLTTAGYGLSYGFWPFLLARMAWGLGWTCINVGGMAMALDISTAADRGRVTGIYNTWMWGGFALAPLLGGFLVDRIGFRPAMGVAAALTAVGLLAVLLALPETARPRSAADRPPARRTVRQRLAPLRRILTRRWLRAHRRRAATSLLLLITRFAGEGVAVSTISLLLQRRFGPTIALDGMVLGVATVGGALLATRSLLAGAVGPLAGRLSDARAGRRPVITASLLIGMSGFALLAFATTPAAILLGVVLGAVSGGAALATLLAQMGDLTPAGREGAMMGAYATIGDIGSTAGPAVAFAMAAAVNLEWVYLLCALIFLLGLGLAAQLR